MGASILSSRFDYTYQLLESLGAIGSFEPDWAGSSVLHSGESPVTVGGSTPRKIFTQLFSS